MNILSDVRHEFSDAVIPRIKFHVAVTASQYPNVAVACVGDSSAGVMLNIEDGRAAALAILLACAQKERELGRAPNPDAETAINFLRKAVG